MPPPVPSPPWSRELCRMGLRSRVLPGHDGGAADAAPLVPGPLGHLSAPRGRLAVASWAAARPLGLLPADVSLAGLGWCGKPSGFPRGSGCPAGSSAPPRGRSAFHRAAAGWRIAPSSFLWLPGSPRLPCLLEALRLLPCPAGAGAGRPEGGCQGLAPGPSPAPLAAHLHARHPSSAPRREGRRALLPL